MMIDYDRFTHLRIFRNHEEPVIEKVNSVSYCLGMAIDELAKDKSVYEIEAIDFVSNKSLTVFKKQQ